MLGILELVFLKIMLLYLFLKTTNQVLIEKQREFKHPAVSVCTEELTLNSPWPELLEILISNKLDKSPQKNRLLSPSQILWNMISKKTTINLLWWDVMVSGKMMMLMIKTSTRLNGTLKKWRWKISLKKRFSKESWVKNQMLKKEPTTWHVSSLSSNE